VKTDGDHNDPEAGEGPREIKELEADSPHEPGR